MAKRKKTRRTRRGRGQRSSDSVVDRLLHLQTPGERPWKFLLPVLALAFVVRAAIALCGDFVLHPDEIMQYLEPAHRLVFGNGVTYGVLGVFLWGAGMAGARCGCGNVEGVRLCRAWRAGLVLFIHSVQAHKEYRFVFAVIPLWLVIGADVVARVRGNARVWGLVGVLFAAVSLGGILNALPSQDQVYRGYSKETGKVGFIRGHDPIFAVFRYLARAPGVLGVWQVDRPYFNLPGYYYLHREIPFYDAYSGRVINRDMETISASVSHIVSGDTNLAIPGYTVEKNFGDVQIWHRDENEAPVRQWEAYNPIIGGVEQIMKHVDPDAPTPPLNMGIRFTTESK